MPRIRNVSQRPQGTKWKLLECGTGQVLTIEAQNGNVYALGTGVPWQFRYRETNLMLERTVSGSAPLVVNGNEYGDEERYSVVDADFSVVVKDSFNNAQPWLLFQPRTEFRVPPRYYVCRTPGAGQAEGPFRSWQELEDYLDGGHFPEESMVLIEGTDARFELKHLLGKFGQAAYAPPPPPPPVAPAEVPSYPSAATSRPAYAAPSAASVSQGTSTGKSHAKPPVPFHKDGGGKLVCLYCRERFEEEDYYYFPEHSDLIDEPPGPPSDWDLEGRPLDALGCICKDRACPHCGGRLPDSFGPHTSYTIISLVGQPATGKSYYIGTMGRKLAPALGRHGVDLMHDDPELNKPFLRLCNIPFQPSDPNEKRNLSEEVQSKHAPECGHGDCTGGCWRRYIDKTDEGQATQASIWYDRLAYSVPKPFIMRIMDQRSGGLVRLVLYDNAGEDFTPVDRRLDPIRARKGQIASGHLAHASFVMVLFDPTIDNRFRAKLGLPPLDQQEDVQQVMLTSMRDRMEEVRTQQGQQQGPSDVPLAVLVGKSDAWDRLVPELHHECFTADGHLDMTIVKKNSAMLISLLDEMETGIPQAARCISRNLCFFPVSALGHQPVRCFHPQTLQAIWAPPRPAQPRGVEVPVLWGLWKAGLIGDEEGEA